MAAHDISEEDVLISYAPIAGGYKPEDLETKIAQIWRAEMATEDGQTRIAAALGVAPADLAQAKTEAPLAGGPGESGFFGVPLAVAVHWTVVNVALPVFVGLTKDAIKAKLLQLWRDVIKPKIDEQGGDEKLGDELRP